MNKSEPATKDDVEEIVQRVVTDVVGGVASNILTVMTQRFEQVDKSMESMEMRLNGRMDGMDGRLESIDNRLNRVENILRPTTNKVDDHEVRLKRLELEAA